MITTILLLLTGFVVGLIYSRGKADPVSSAIDDVSRLAGKIVGALRRAWNNFSEAKDTEKRP